MSWVAVAIIGSAAIGAAAGSYASGKAAKAQTQAAQTAAGTQLSMFQQQREDLAPWREAGGRAVNALEGLVKAGPGTYQKSPYYDFLLGEGTKALERGASARGRQLSGAQGKALTQYGQNLASTDYDNWLKRWYQSLTPYQSLAGLGQTAGIQTGLGALQTGQGVAGSQLAAGQAQAAGQLGQIQPWVNTLNYGTNQLANYYMMNRMGMFGNQTPAYSSQPYGYGDAGYNAYNVYDPNLLGPQNY